MVHAIGQRTAVLCGLGVFQTLALRRGSESTSTNVERSLKLEWIGASIAELHLPTLNTQQPRRLIVLSSCLVIGWMGRKSGLTTLRIKSRRVEAKVTAVQCRAGIQIMIIMVA